MADADLCPGWLKAASECQDPHCEEREADDAGLRCAPYSPPAAVCGQGDQACAPQCCQELSVGTVAEPDRTMSSGCRRNGVPMTPDELNETRIEGLANEIIAEFKRQTELSATTPEPVNATPPSAVEVATAAARQALEQGDTLIAFPGQATQQQIDLVHKVMNGPESILLEAERIVNGARRGSYGTPENNFGRIADLWTAYLNGKPGGPLPITPQDTALMMILMKCARLLETPVHRDSIVDIAGYAACVETLWAEQAERAAKRGLDVD